MVEVDVHIVRLQLPQAAFQGVHEGLAAAVGPGSGLGGDDEFLALALQGLADDPFGLPIGVAFGRVEVVDAARHGMMHQRFFPLPQAAGAEGNIGDAKLGAPQADVATHLVAGIARLPLRRLGLGGQPDGAGEGAGLEKTSSGSHDAILDLCKSVRP